MLMRSAQVWDITQRGVVIQTDISGQPIDPILKGQEVPRGKTDCLTLKGGTDTLSRNVGKGLPLDAA
jgi:hypothetical protein